MMDAQPIIFPDKYPEPLQIAVIAIYRYLVSTAQLPHQAATEAAFGAVDAMRHDVGGGILYINKGVSYEADLRGKEIYARWNGRNIKQLAREFKLTEERVRQIIKARKAADRQSRQTMLDLSNE